MLCHYFLCVYIFNNRQVLVRYWRVIRLLSVTQITFVTLSKRMLLFCLYIKQGEFCISRCCWLVLLCSIAFCRRCIYDAGRSLHQCTWELWTTIAINLTIIWAWKLICEQVIDVLIAVTLDQQWTTHCCLTMGLLLLRTSFTDISRNNFVPLLTIVVTINFIVDILFLVIDGVVLRFIL